MQPINFTNTEEQIILASLTQYGINDKGIKRATELQHDIRCGLNNFSLDDLIILYASLDFFTPFCTQPKIIFPLLARIGANIDICNNKNKL